MITVYGRPGCASCDQTVNFLTRHNIAYTYIDVDADPDAAADLDPADMALPYVRTPHDAWSGFRYAKLKELVGQHL